MIFSRGRGPYKPSERFLEAQIVKNFFKTLQTFLILYSTIAYLYPTLFPPHWATSGRASPSALARLPILRLIESLTASLELTGGLTRLKRSAARLTFIGSVLKLGGPSQLFYKDTRNRLFGFEVIPAFKMDSTGMAIPPTCKVILAATIARGLLAEVKEGLSGLHKKPVLVGFLANEDPAAQMYADWSAKTCIEK
jgi:hypothetical protein